MIRCPFCFWNRTPDHSKGAPPFDEKAAMEELINHLTLEHAQDAFNLRIGLTPMIDVEEGSPAAPWNGGDES